eukprot:5251595-Pyramimonas_sp.AAC.2
MHLSTRIRQRCPRGSVLHCNISATGVCSLRSRCRTGCNLRPAMGRVLQYITAAAAPSGQIPWTMLVCPSPPDKS